MTLQLLTVEICDKVLILKEPSLNPVTGYLFGYYFKTEKDYLLLSIIVIIKRSHNKCHQRDSQLHKIWAAVSAVPVRRCLLATMSVM
jgi:hypothetical protein